MRTVQNTANTDPMMLLMGAMVNPSGHIEAMEAAGQRQLVASEVLPTDCGGKDKYIELGFTFGDPVEGDKMFMAATLPEGWKRKGSEHAMWSYIEDERGIERVSIFYKAAFYDRSAHMGLNDVGGCLMNKAICGDGEPVIEQWDVLTASERESAIGALKHHRKNCDEHPKIYGDRLPRVEKLEQLYAAPATRSEGDGE